MSRLHHHSLSAQLLALCLMVLMPLSLVGQTEAEDAAQPTEVDRLAPDFVLASVIVAEPFDVLYSCYGHAALRLQCPTYQLDYIFSCEGEPVQDNISRFLLGRLQMGVYALPTASFLAEYSEQGRGVTEYPLNLSPEAKQRLWQQMDERVKLPHTPYDFVANGCAHLILKWVSESLGEQYISFGAWPESFSLTRKQIAGHACRHFAWNHLFISTLIDGSINSACVKRDKVILPQDLVFVMQHATIQGQPLLRGAPVTLLPSLQQYGGSSTLTSPLLLTSLLLVITLALLLGGRRSSSGGLTLLGRIWCYLMLALQSVLGLFLCYLVLFSSLPCTEWNWLLIPFNPLPLLLWHWRSRWQWFALIVDVIWCIALVAAPFIYHDYAYLPLALTMGLLPWLCRK